MTKEKAKQAPGRLKYSMSVIPPQVLAEVQVAMLEGAIKYGPFNWRETQIYYSDYYNPAFRHLMAWWEGEDNDQASQLSHITKTITSLIVLRDAMMCGTAIDDRPSVCAYDQSSTEQWDEHINLLTENLRKRMEK